MRALLLCSELAVSANGTANSTAILLTGSGGAAQQEAVPGEDVAFSSSGSAVVALSLEGVTSGSGDTIAIQTSVDYYSKAGSSPTYTTAKSYSPGSLTTKSKTVFLDKVPLGEAVRVSVTSTHTSGAGTITAYLLQT